MPQKILSLLLIFASLTSIALAWKSTEWKITLTEPAGWKKRATEEGVTFYSPDGKGYIIPTSDVVKEDVSVKPKFMEEIQNDKV